MTSIIIIVSLHSFYRCHHPVSSIHSDVFSLLFRLHLKVLIAVGFISVRRVQSTDRRSFSTFNFKTKMLIKLVVALVVCLSFLHLSVQVEAATVCPPANVISPCACSQWTPTTTYLNCQSRVLTDSQASAILDAYLKTPNVSPVGVLQLSNNLLTRVPDQMKSFTQLEYAILDFNSITSIESGAFNFTDAANPLRSLYLSTNQLTTIAPGAFKGSNLIYFFPLPFNCY